VPVYLLDDTDEELFPPPEGADASGIVALGGSITPRRLLAAYSRGIFPWYSEGQPVLWHSPNPRFALEPRALHVPKSLRKTMKHAPYTLAYDTRFEDVMRACGEAPRVGQSGTWITDAMLEGYVALHELGFAHSAEAYRDGELVGGLYGVWLGSVFFGESMFAHAPDASKIAFATLVEKLVLAGCTLVDCQAETEHLARFGAENWPRTRFLAELRNALRGPTQRGRWDPVLGPAPR
jgi:leucyl/phenylalanyl-tRNA--protein transferase